MMPSQCEVTYITPQYPRQLRIDSTTKCNASCLSCHRFLTKRSGEIPWALINTILSDISKWANPLIEIVPVNYGEFFLHQDWYDILKAINMKLPRTQIVIPTNGSLFDDWTVEKLARIENQMIINFSINAYYQETYEKFTGLPYQTTEKITKAIVLLRAMKPTIRVHISMVFDPTYSTDYERDEFIKHWSRFGQVNILPAASAMRPDKESVIPVRIPCRSIFSDIVIGYDRRLSSCCFDSDFSISLGNYSGNLLTDWQNEYLEKLRKAHNEHHRDKYALCSRCTFA